MFRSTTGHRSDTLPFCPVSGLRNRRVVRCAWSRLLGLNRNFPLYGPFMNNYSKCSPRNIGVY